jgi:hypothetical protein
MFCLVIVARSVEILNNSPIVCFYRSQTLPQKSIHTHICFTHMYVGFWRIRVCLSAQSSSQYSFNYFTVSGAIYNIHIYIYIYACWEGREREGWSCMTFLCCLITLSYNLCNVLTMCVFVIVCNVSILKGSTSANPWRAEVSHC